MSGRLLACIAVFASAVASPSPLKAQAVSPEPIVRAERAFAADALVMGLDRSFVAHSTADAILMRREPAIAHQVLDADAAVDPAAPSLAWWPLWAGVSMSGDLGFSTGPVEVGGVRQGHYITVWARQADGSWKWVFDGGSQATSEAQPSSAAEPVYLPAAGSGAGSAERAMTEVGLAERALADGARERYPSAMAAVLADDGRLYSGRHEPATSRARFEALLAGGPASVTFGAPLGGGASSAGDLAWVYGPADWSGASPSPQGYYVRVWQKRPEGWRVVLAQITPRR